MNDEEKMSSSNTTPFNNVNKHNKVLNNEKLAKYTGFRQLRPRNNVNNENINGRINDIPPVSDKKDDSKQQNNDNEVSNNNKRNVRRNPFGPKNRLNNTASNLRDKLDTNTDIKDQAAKKGVEALKKSANPYAKATGYAASFLQKKKEKKKKEENKDDEKKDENDNDKNEDNKDDSSTSLVENKTRTRLIIHLTLLILPYVLGFIIIISTFLPLLNAYSWFQSLFHHKSDDADSYYIYNDNQKEKSDEEIAFNDAIVGSKDGSVKGIIQEYKEKYGVTIDKCLLVATVTYRYSVVDSDKVYSDDGNNDINDEEINSRLEELEENDSNDSNEETNNSETNNSVDYSKAKKKINAVAALMIKKNGSSYTTDKEVGGDFYNTLIDSQFLKDYYKDLLSDDKYETRKRLVDEIFEYAEGARLMDDDDDEPSVNGGVIGDTSIVHLQTCKQPYSYENRNGLEVYNNPAWNEGTEYPDYLNMKDYIKGSLYREIGVDRGYLEAMKAQAIAALTYIINDSGSGFNLKTGEMYFPSGTCRQATCSPTYGCTSVAVTGTIMHTFYVGEHRFAGGQSYGPINESDDAILEEVLNAVFGKIMVKKGVTTATFSGSSDASSAGYLDKCSPGTCFSQQDAKNDARSGMNYEQILAKYYSGYQYDIIDITEGLYTSGGYANAEYNGNIVYYSQHSYKDVQFCGRSGASISSSGCGVTSAAIVASSLTGNTKYDPKYMMEWAYREGECGTGISGTNDGFFIKFATQLGLKYQRVKKENANLVVEALKTGNALVIAHMGNGHFTGGGHYIVLSAVNDKGEVMVQDPNDKNKNHYWSINLIANEISDHGDFHIISK